MTYIRPVLLTVIPSRGRPHAVAELVHAFTRTCTSSTSLIIAVDDDDPERQRYVEAVRAVTAPVTLWTNEGEKTMVAALNGTVADFYHPGISAVCFMGDDHRPRTVGWDRSYITALREMGTGIVYGDDLLQGAAIPTQVAMTADIPHALGYMAPPVLTHLFVDNYWKALGEGAGCLRYLPDVVIEHVHPIAGKAVWDEGHRRVNTRQMYAKDEAAFQAYADTLASDVEKVKALR